MLLTTILDQARNGELKSLSTKDKTDEVVIGYVNSAIAALYTRFSIKTEEALVTLRTNKTIYSLDATDGDVLVNGSPIPADDVLGIISAFDELGSSLPINDPNQPYGIYTPSYNAVQIPYSVDGAYISIIYRQNPTLLVAEDIVDAEGALNVLTTNVEIPMQLLEPLLHFIGYRAHGSVDGMIEKENNTHYMRFKGACAEVEALGVMTYDSMPSRDVSMKGFV